MKIKKNDLDLNSTLMSGQAFRITKELDNSYTCILTDRVVNIKEDNDFLIVNSNKEENLEMVVKHYLDYGRDYSLINEKLSTSDVFYGGVPSGYKVLKQDKFEMYISYIISQNNKTYYLFPKMSDMINLTKDNLKEFNLGFRDEYIYNALNVLKENPFYLEELDMLNTDVALKSLMKIKGIGLKVASCILMFGYSRFDTFPIDTWVKKYVSEKLGIKDDIKVISKYMKEIFNEYSGLAIQYMYHINRNRKLD